MICTTACVYVTYNATAESNVQLFSPLNTTEVCGDGPTADWRAVRDELTVGRYTSVSLKKMREVC